MELSSAAEFISTLLPFVDIESFSTPGKEGQTLSERNCDL